MKHTLFSLLALSVLATTPAFSGEVGVVTKYYVDDGLKHVYNKAKEMDAAINNRLTQTNDKLDVLTLYIGAPSDGETPTGSLTQRIEDLSDEINGIEYSGVNGVSVEDDEVSINGLSDTTAEDGKIYVFKNNTASELEVANTWTTPQ